MSLHVEPARSEDDARQKKEAEAGEALQPSLYLGPDVPGAGFAPENRASKCWLCFFLDLAFELLVTDVKNQGLLQIMLNWVGIFRGFMSTKHC